MTRRPLGEYQDLTWDGDGTPSAHYVSGHVDEASFRGAVEAYFSCGGSKRKPILPDELKLDHVYVRSVPSSSSDLDHREWRHVAKGRGAAAMTVWTIAPHRGDGS